MEKYLGVKLIEARQVPDGCDGHPGYTVIYEDGYESWSPKEVFEKAYRRIDNLTFGLAIEALKEGKKVARVGWNGKNMYLALVEASHIKPEQARSGAALALANEGFNNIDIMSHIDMRAADGSIVVGWLASQTDMLAEDWCIIN